MTKHVSTPMGPLAPPDNPSPSKSGPSSPSKMVGLFHQYPPVDLVDKETHRIPKGGVVGPSGTFVGTEVIPPNELKAINKAGLHATVHKAYALQQQRKHTLENASDVPTEIALNILEADRPSDYNSVTRHASAGHPIKEASINTLAMDHPLSHTGPSEPAVHHLPHLEASILADNLRDTPTFKDKVGDWVDDTPLNLSLNPHKGNRSAPPLPYARVIQSACDIRIHWDDLGDISEISAPTKEVAEMICSKLNGLLLSDGKDSILKAISRGTWMTLLKF